MIDFNTFKKLPKNVGDLGKFIVGNGFKKLPKVQYIAQSGHTGREARVGRTGGGVVSSKKTFSVNQIQERRCKIKSSHSLSLSLSFFLSRSFSSLWIGFRQTAAKSRREQPAAQSRKPTSSWCYKYFFGGNVENLEFPLGCNGNNKPFKMQVLLKNNIVLTFLCMFRHQNKLFSIS